MTRYVVRRVLLSIITLLLLVTIVFVIVNVLPNDVGRQHRRAVRAAGDGRPDQRAPRRRTIRCPCSTCGC